jgi:4-hydroxybenzoate polyprenyltransferase
MTVEKDPREAALTHPALRPGPPVSCNAGEDVERSETGEGLAAVEAPADRSDIHQNDWVERWLPAAARPYARLARLDRPIGTWLLLFPGWWGIALASPRWPDPVLLLLFAIGAVAMRGAGCTLNDIADRDYDGQVARTRLRPLPSSCS